MSDKDKSKPSKSVMGNLPATRPTRMGRKRDGEPVAKATRASAKPKATAKKPAGRPAAKPRAGSASPKPRAVRSGSPSLDAATPKKPRAHRRPAPKPPKGAELVTTAVQATGELAKIGLTLGGQALKRAARRLPKP